MTGSVSSSDNTPDHSRAPASALLVLRARAIHRALTELVEAYRGGQAPSLVDLDAATVELRALHRDVIACLGRPDAINLDDLTATRVALSQARPAMAELLQELKGKGPSE